MGIAFLSRVGPRRNGEAKEEALLDELRGQMEAVNRVQALIRFTPDGTIVDANENFLRTVGYSLDELRGHHHRILVDPGYAQSQAYTDFWTKLRRGEFDRGEYRRIGKGGKEVWLLASYNPVFNARGELTSIVKFATDVTAEKLKNSETRARLEAIDRVQGVIEFDMQGVILTANPIFLGLMGYTLAEIVGRPHSIFVEPGFEKSEAYRQFWENLRAGRPDARVFRRVGKGGRPIWIQASYNPIPDLNGRPMKVVKFASDLTDIISQTQTTQTTAQTVAAATEEMSASIGEISRNMELSRGATEEIRKVSSTSGVEASHLLDSVKAMERVVNLIRAIAGQVNMLALNATIEAARAGAAGKGFAVVANEVKNLSNETARATGEIDREIAAIQEVSSRVAKSIQQTIDGVAQVDQYVSSIATAMEEQTAVTREISRHSTDLVSAVEAILDRAQRSSAS